MKPSTSSADFKARLDALGDANDPAVLSRGLQAVANLPLNYPQALQLARVIESSDPQTLGLKVRKVAIVASSTIDHLVTGIRVAGVRHGMYLDVWCGQYGQYRQEIMAPSEGLRSFGPDTILFSLHPEHLCRPLPLTATPDAVAAQIEVAVDELAQLWHAARTHFGCAIVQQTCLDITDPVFGSFDRLVPASPFQQVQALNQRIAERAREAQVGLLDVARQSARDGIDHWHDRSRWYQAKMLIAPSAVVDYGELLARNAAATTGLARKCLVLDLDNTLWGGVVGDDGVEGLVLGEGTAQGEAFLAVQEYALMLKARGIPLAICSKNEVDNAKAPFLTHPEMRLTLDDISVFVANWNDKATNIQAIAQQLNLGLESLVFVDDNPAERQRVREAFPMVAVPELPENPAEFVRCVSSHGYFEAVTFTQEDADRAAQYAANAKRTELQAASVSMDDYLAGLDMALTYGPIGPMDLARATQLIGKTNQFNTTTRRYTQEQVTAFAEAELGMTVQCRLEDRFGDNGLISVMLLQGDAEDPHTLTLVNWVMSCRVFGREVELELMNIVAEQARARQVSRLYAEFIPSPKNTIISSLFESLGFRQESPDTADAPQRWLLDIDEYQPRSTQIARRPIE